MYNVLDALLMMSLIQANHSDKKTIKKLMLKLAKILPHKVKLGTVSRVLGGEKLSFLTTLHLSIVASAKEHSENGCHVMVVVGGVTHGIVINCREEGDLQWCLLNEAEMALSCAHATMNALNLKLLECNVILFKHIGYSGAAHSLTIEPGVVNKFSRKIGNTQYFR